MATPQDQFRGASFVSGAVDQRGMPTDVGVEVAFAGRSNAGKSSAINALTGFRALARTSKAPGRTREINFFTLGGERRLVDLPGYGFARVPDATKAAWAALVSAYLAERRSLQGVVQLMDVRHPFTPLDRQLIDWCRGAGLPIHIVLTKSDKLGRGQQGSTLAGARREARDWQAVTVQLFSATRRDGVEELALKLLEWMPVESATDDASGQQQGTS